MWETAGYEVKEAKHCFCGGNKGYGIATIRSALQLTGKGKRIDKRNTKLWDAHSTIYSTAEALLVTHTEIHAPVR